MSALPVKVSDHALLRYLERVRGVDIEAARAEVVAITGTAVSLGAHCVARDGHVFALDGYTVVTVLPKGGHYAWPRGGRR